MKSRVLFVLAAVLFAHPAAARDPLIKDGRFTICAFQNFDKCELLTARAFRRHHPSARDRRIVAALKRYVAARRVSPASLEEAFGKPSKIQQHAEPTDQTYAWYDKSVGLSDLNAKCPECGIYIRVSGNVVVSLNYIVDGKFTLAWNRAAR